MQRKQLFLLALACTWAFGVSAQWQWVDKDGRKVFSDRPPPQDVPERNILKQPTLRAAPPATAAAAATAAAGDEPPAADAAPTPAAAPALAISRDDTQLQEKKAKAEAAEAARKQAEQQAEAQRQAKARKENCARARQAAASLSSGVPMAHTNAQGERGYMDEATRAAELRRAQEIAARDCQ